MIHCGVEVESILLITMDRPPANAIDQAMGDGLEAAFARYEADPALRACIITGAGEKIFSAGWDLKAMLAGEAAEENFGPGGYMGLTERWSLTKPVIAAINGTAAGGGFELALACDLIVAVNGCKFLFPEARHGLVAEGGGVIRAPLRLPEAIARELLLTGRPASAEELAQYGFINRVVPREALLDTARGWARAIAMAAPTSIAATKQIMDRTAHLSIREAYAAMRDGSLPEYRRMRASPNRDEGPRAFVEKRKPRWVP